MKHEINPKETSRAYAFEMWMRAPMPMVTFFKTLDVTGLIRVCKQTGTKFNMLMCYCIGKAASGIKEFYLLPEGDKLMQFDSIAVNTIVANKEGEVSSCDIPFCEDVSAFNRNYLQLTKQVADTCTNHDLPDSMVIGTSALAQHGIDGAVGMYSGIFNNPFLIWGKYKRRFFKTTLTVSFQFHHTQMDGAHAGKFLSNLQEEINRLCKNKLGLNKDIMEQKFCQSCGMPLTEAVLGTNSDGSKNEDYCIYCYKDGKFLQECTMDEMIEHCAQFVNEVNKGLPQPITKEEYIGQMKIYFPHLKRWRKFLAITENKAMPDNPAMAGVKELIAQMADSLPIAYISSVDYEGFPWTKAMLAPRKREGIKIFYFTTNTFSIRVAHYKANPKACIYFCDAEGFKGMMLRGTMEVLTDAKSKEMMWCDGDEQYYPSGVTDPNYCVLKFTASDGRFYSDFYPRSFVIE